MGLSLDDLERKVSALERGLRSAVEAIKQQGHVDFLQQNYPGDDDVTLTADRLALFPIFPQAPIQAATVYIGARRDPGNPGTSRVQLALYRAELPSVMEPFLQDKVQWSSSGGGVITEASLSSNRLEWRLITQSDILSSSATSYVRLRWLFPQEYLLKPGGSIYAIGIVTNSVFTQFEGLASVSNYAGAGYPEAVVMGALPSQVKSYPTSANFPISLTLYSKRGTKVLGV